MISFAGFLFSREGFEFSEFQRDELLNGARKYLGQNLETQLTSEMRFRIFLGRQGKIFMLK
jgi:hypothetical protein